MSAFRRFISAFAWLAFAAVLPAAPAHADQLVYVPLAQPCRLLDTRTSTGGPGPLTADHGAYLFGTSNSDISSTMQHGSTSGCGIPAGIEAISVNMNMLNTTASGNIATWSADLGASAPNIGTGVYNPSVADPRAGQVMYNTGYTTISVSQSPYTFPYFYLQVANGQIDMTINVVGYWTPISWSEVSKSRFYANALGYKPTASGDYSIAMGYEATATGITSVAIGDLTTASADQSTALGFVTKAKGGASTAMGFDTTASGIVSTAMGRSTLASGGTSTAMGNGTQALGQAATAMGFGTVAGGDYSTAMGYYTVADGSYSLVMGSRVGSGGHLGSFIYGDASTRSDAHNTADNQFLAVASGGVYFFTNPDRTAGAGLPPGSSSWIVLSDRSAKTAVQPIDGREVLKKVTALPLNTWQYKTQDPKYRHMGPMAQDFYAAFRLGESDKGIDTVDADGVALAAIQGLNALVMEKEAKTAEQLEEKDREIAVLRNEKNREIAALRGEMSAQVKGKDAEIATLHAEVLAQKKRVAALESLAGDVANLKIQFSTLRQSSAASITVALEQP